MANGINKVILVGNLGEAPSVRLSANNEQVATFSLATSESWKDKQTGQRQERTEWHRIVAFSGLAKICAQYLTTGTKVYCEGSLRTTKYTGQDGVDRWSTQVIISEMQILANGVPRQEGAGQGRAAPESHYNPPPRTNPNGTQTSPYGAPQNAGGYPDDDIPFY